MPRTTALLLAAAVLGGIAGCHAFPLSTGAGPVLKWSLPAGVEGPSHPWYVDVSSPGLIWAAGVSVYTGLPGGSVVAADFSFDVGGALAMGRGAEPGVPAPSGSGSPPAGDPGCRFATPNPWPTVRPVLGLWFWPESDDSPGALTGLRVGATWALGGQAPNEAEHIVSIEYGWLTLHEFAEEEDARLQALMLTLVW